MLNTTLSRSSSSRSSYAHPLRNVQPPKPQPCLFTRVLRVGFIVAATFLAHSTLSTGGAVSTSKRAGDTNGDSDQYDNADWAATPASVSADRKIMLENLQAARTILQVHKEADAEAKAKFQGTFKGEQVGQLFSDMANFLKDTGKKLDPHVKRFQDTTLPAERLDRVMGDLQKKATVLTKLTDKLKPVLDKYEKLEKQEKAADAIKTDGIHSPSQKVAAYQHALQDSKSRLTEFKNFMEQGEKRKQQGVKLSGGELNNFIAKSLELTMASGSSLEKVEKLKIADSEKTDEIKNLEKEVTDLQKFAQDLFSKNKKNKPEPKFSHTSKPNPRVHDEL